MCEVEAVEDKALFVGLGVKVLSPLAFCDGDTSVGVEGLVCLAVDGHSPDEPTTFLDFLDKLEVSDKGLFRLKEEFLLRRIVISWSKDISLKEVTALLLETLDQ